MLTGSVACLLLACGGAQPSPFFGDAEYLRFGVDPRVEAAAAETQLKRAGYQLRDRAEGPHHVALGFVDPVTSRSAVRVATSRGTALSLDSEATPESPRQYTLVTAEQLVDVDALPADQVFVSVSGERGSTVCIAGFRASADGTLARLVIDAGAVIVDGCASEIADINGDGNVELIVQAAFETFAAVDPPLLRVPLSAQGNGYRLVMGVGPMVILLAQQRAQANRELSAARHALDVDRAFRSAVELAAIVRFEGGAMGDQLKTLDTALRGLVLTGRQAATIEHARQLIREGWSSVAAEVAAEGEPEAVAEEPETEVDEPTANEEAQQPPTVP